ncbi:hypothetical protein SLEP1_g22675 [Rubroshorea leprosula]|uniref:Uncharacterized protein n=1 Tax=Rubroshorea leprosula TaxID=152421 RepID=A0AAV5JJ44_9ROSI|nr:hypothetical protein SLEP1_g22675 [Rubroshorea leprosula]
MDSEFSALCQISESCSYCSRVVTVHTLNFNYLEYKISWNA